MSDFTYRIIKSSWGIHITIRAAWHHLTEYQGDSSKISEKLYFANKVKNLSSREIRFLHFGFESMATEFDESFTDRKPVVIVVEDIVFNPCDYQDEGLACAVMGWISQEFDLTAPIVNVTFDKMGNHYEFQFPNNHYESVP